MVEKIEKLQFAMMIRASNPKVKEAEINTLWQDYQETGKLPAETSESLAGQANWGYSVGFEKFNQPQKEPVYSQLQSIAMNFLEGNLNAAKENMTEREDEAGALSWCVNSWKEIFDKELAKSTVKSKIEATATDVAQLKKAASGELLTTNYINGTKEKISFEETFQKQRGVKFSQAAIEDCTKKADTFAQTKMAKTIIDNLKSTLKVLGTGDTVSQFMTREKSKAIFDGLKLCGIEKRAQMDEILADIENKFKDTPEVQQYGGQWQFAKKGNKYKNPPEIVRMTSSGYFEPVTNEQYKIISNELNLRLNRAYASAIGCETPENKTGEQTAELAQKQFEKHQKEYETSFAKAYGKKDLKELSERYVAAQQKGVENIEMVINISSMALMVVPGGAAVTANWGLKGALAAKNSATLGNLARGMHLVDKAKDTINFTQKVVSLTQKASPLIMGNMIARPTYLAEQLSSKNGMSTDEWQQWGLGVLQSSAYMALGMGSGKLAEQGAAMYKTKALVNTLKNSGRSADEIAAMIKANPVKFPKDIVQSFGKINTTARLLQVPTEVALDLGSTYALNKAMNNEELRTQDWVNSLMFAINGSVIQKQFKSLSQESKADLLLNSFKEYGMTKPEALNVLKTMDDISAGKIRVKKTAADAEPLPERKTSAIGYELSRNIHRGERALNYTKDKIVGSYEKGKKIAKGLSSLVSTQQLDSRLKKQGMEGRFLRENIVKILEKSNFESEEICNRVLNAIKDLRRMNVEQNDIDSVLYKLATIEPDNTLHFNQTSVDVLEELSKIDNLIGGKWAERECRDLFWGNQNSNVEFLTKLKAISSEITEGSNLASAKKITDLTMRNGESKVEDRMFYKEILESNLVQDKPGWAGAENEARDYYKLCCDPSGKPSAELWSLFNEISGKFTKNRAENILKLAKSNDIAITKQNLEIIQTYNNGILDLRALAHCKDDKGAIDCSRYEDAKAAVDLNSSDAGWINRFKNKDGTFNKEMIASAQQLKDAGFEAMTIGNILHTHNPELISMSIDFKNKNVEPSNIPFLLEGCIENGKIDTELAQMLIPIGQKLQQHDNLPVSNFLMNILTFGDLEYKKSTCQSLETLLDNGFSLHSISMCKIFSGDSLGVAIAKEVIDTAILLRKEGVSDFDFQETLALIKSPDRSINKEYLDLMLELKTKGFGSYEYSKIIEICKNKKGEIIPQNKEIVLGLIDECSKTPYIKDKHAAVKADNIWSNSTDRHDEVKITDILINASLDEAGIIRLDILNANKAELQNLYKTLEDKESFVFYLDAAVDANGKFDINVIHKINELNKLDDGMIDPSYAQTTKNLIGACKNDDGNFDAQMYDNALKLIKKYHFNKHTVSYKLPLYEQFKWLEKKNNIYELSLQEKRKLQSTLLQYNKQLKENSELKTILKTNLIPRNDIEYSNLMKQLSQSLNQNDAVLSPIVLGKLNSDLQNLTNNLKANTDISEVFVSKTYENLLSEITQKMSGLDAIEKRKIFDYFGFTINDNNISGFPSTFGKNVKHTDITNAFSVKVADEITRLIDNSNNNNAITVKGNQELSSILTSISKSVPEILNKFSDPIKAQDAISVLSKISKAPDFEVLSNNDKQILILATLLKDSNIGTTKESAYKIYNLSNKFNLSHAERTKLYDLLAVPDLVNNYLKTDPSTKTTRHYRGSNIVSNAKEEALDLLAVAIKDKNLDELSYLLYSDEKVINADLKTELQNRIKEIKKDDFILPQTQAETFRQQASSAVIGEYKVNVVKASDIPNFYAYLHTPEAGACNHASRITKFSNFEEFSNIDSDAIICTSFVSADKTAAWKEHGFVFNVTSGNEYVGCGHDMFSLGKNKTEMIAEYYRDKGLKALSGKGYKYSHRTNISGNLKDALSNSEYSRLSKEKQSLHKQLSEFRPTDKEYLKIELEIQKINEVIQKIDDEYSDKISNIKNQISSKQINLDEIRSVDPKLADAYDEFLSKDNTKHKMGKDALLRNDYWNEVLISNPTISAIYTKNLDKLPKEYLQMAQEQDIPIVIL